MAVEGITSAQDAWAGWIAPEEFRAYQEACAAGILPQHIRLMPDSERLAIKDGRFDFAFGLHTGFGDGQLKLGAMKFFLDGSLIGRTAALTAPYCGTPADSGFLVKSEEEIHARIARAHRGGWQVAMHAIGDRAIEAGLDAIEACMGRDAGRYRPRIEHCGVLRPDLIARIRRLGVVSSPSHSSSPSWATASGPLWGKTGYGSPTRWRACAGCGWPSVRIARW